MASSFGVLPHAFCLMPFANDDILVVYEEYLKPALEKCPLRCMRDDRSSESWGAVDHVMGAIHVASIVIADLTGQDSNIMYEVGLARAVDKPVLLLSQTIADVPSDLLRQPILLYEYSPRGCRTLERGVTQRVLELSAATSPALSPPSQGWQDRLRQRLGQRDDVSRV